MEKKKMLGANTMNRPIGKIHNYSKRKKSTTEHSFYEHDTRIKSSDIAGSIRSTVNVINQTNLNHVHMQTQKVYQQPIRVKKKSYRSDANCDTNINMLQKQLLRQQQKLQKQLQTLQTQKCIASLVSSCCCTHNLVSNKNILSAHKSKRLQWVDNRVNEKFSSNNRCFFENAQSTLRYEYWRWIYNMNVQKFSAE